MPNSFRKYLLKQEQFKDIQALLYKLKDFQGLEFLFPNSRTFKDFQVLYEPWRPYDTLHTLVIAFWTYTLQLLWWEQILATT